jgi:nuclear pore complex protein Nup85
MACHRSRSFIPFIIELTSLIRDITSGQEAFISYVDLIPTSLLRASFLPDSGSVPLEDEEDEGTSLNRYALASRLNFLARYREFFALYARGERQKAAELLVSLLTSKTAPKRFWAVS